MYPIWLTMWNDRMRLTSLWAMAPSTPTTMVSAAIHSSTVDASPPVGNSRVWVRTMAYTPTLVSRPAKMAVTWVGAVGYLSGSQKNRGKMAALMPNTTISSNVATSMHPPTPMTRSSANSSVVFTQ